MRGGRGYRGGYRGSSRGISDSSGGGGGGWRGGKSSYTNSSRGGGYSASSRGSYSKWEKETGSVTFDSRPRYSSGGGGGGSGGAGGGGSSVGAAASDLYSSGTRGDERSYRYSREGSAYGRSNSYRGSSPDRKRMRTEYSPATAAHRSHESGYGDVNDYMNRSYSGYGGDMESKRMSRGYSGDRRSFYRDERERTRSNDYQYTKPVASLSVTPRRSSTRGSLRGRTFSKSREVRGGFRRSDSYKGAIAKKRALSESYAVRKRILSGRTQEYLRRLKLYRIRRLEKAERYRMVAGDKKDDKSENKSEDEEEEEYEEIEEEEEEECDAEEGAEDEAEHDESKEEGEKQKKGDEEIEEGEANGVVKKEEGEEKKKKKLKKVIKIRKVKRKVPIKKEDDSKMDVDENKPEGMQVTIKQDSESRAVNDDASSAKKSSSNPFIKLECPHCHVRCVTFKQYNNHLHTSKHMAAMSALTLQLRKTLARMRAEQRDEQRIIDDECKEKNMNMSTFFCTICKLNYRSPKAEHQASVRHKELRDFLLPYCHVCRITFRSPMLHEAHICQLDHIRRKANLEKRLAEKEAEVKDVDMDNFMILDSVGSGEESVEAESEEEKEEQEKTDGEKEAKKKKKKKSEVKLGAEHCKKVEVYYCDLCRIYLPRLDDIERSLVLHCRSRNHLYLYVRYRDDQALRKRAERLHRLREEEKKLKKEEEESKKAKEDEEKKKEDGDKTKDGSPSKVKQDSQMEDADGMDEKMWSEVDKDIGDLLREVEPANKSSDEDDDSRAEDGGRYDRFKHSEKEKSKRNIKVDDDEEDDSLIRNENAKDNEKHDEDVANAVEKDDQ